MSIFSTSIVDLFLLLLLFCHSMHACEGRRLSGKHVKYHSINKDVEKAIPEKTTLISSKKNPCSPEEKRVTDGQNQVAAITTAATPAQKMTKNPQKAMLNDEVDKEIKQTPNNPGFVHQIESLVVSVSWRVPKEKHNEHPGNKIIMFSDVGLQQSTKIEESERQGRSLLESESHDSEETIDSKDNDVEDVGVMDYQQPHRKSPIHNFSP